ncbi:MAG: CHASE4 domain-containing protein [Desulfococcaceae bacterium]
MNIQKKTLLIISSAFILMIALIAVASRMIVLKSFRHLEKQNLQINVRRAESEISSILEFLNSTVTDWAYWNETYEFVQNPGREYIESNLSDESVSALKLNFMIFVNLSGRVVYAKFMDWETLKELNDTEDLLKQLMSVPSLHTHSDEKSVTAGIVKGRHFPILTVSKPVLQNDAKGPVKGALIIGRFLDSREIRRISFRNHFKTDIMACDSPNLPADAQTAYTLIKQGNHLPVIPLNTERIFAYALKNDVMGKPAYVLKVELARDMYQLGRRTVFLYILTLLLIGLVFILIIIFSLHRIVLFPLERLNAEVNQIGNPDDSGRRIRVPSKDEFGNLACNINTMLDQIAKSASRLREAKEAAEAANTAKSRFLAAMSHELRTPLNIILGIARLLIQSREFSDENRKELETVNRSGEHLLALINDVLDLARIESGKQDIAEQETDIHRLLDDMEDMFRVRAREKNLHMVFTRDPDIPRYVMTDKTRLRQVLFNLLGNAVKFTEQGNIYLRVKKSGDSDNEHPLSDRHILHFEIEDSGYGLDPEDMENLFTPFMQAKNRKSAQEGTGLGLVLSRRYVQMMGGDISARSIPGKGSVFRFYIRTAACRESQKKEAVIPQVKSLAPDQPAYRILIADDNPDNRYILVKRLKQTGFEIQEAGDGKEAVEIWKTWQPHLIWMDIRMPLMDGCEATRKIREMETSRTPIIALSASIFEEDRSIVKSAGCDDFLPKPVSGSQIFETIAKYLGVRYVYEDSRTAESEKNMERITAESFRTLSADICMKLKKAAKELDSEMIRKIIADIRQSDSRLAEGLSELADNYEFDKINALVSQDISS